MEEPKTLKKETPDFSQGSSHKDVCILKRGQVQNPLTIGSVLASKYAYARFIEQEAEIDALKQQLQTLRNVLSDFISRCDSAGAEAVTRLNHNIEK